MQSTVVKAIFLEFDARQPAKRAPLPLIECEHSCSQKGNMRRICDHFLQLWVFRKYPFKHLNTSSVCGLAVYNRTSLY